MDLSASGPRRVATQAACRASVRDDLDSGQRPRKVGQSGPKTETQSFDRSFLRQPEGSLRVSSAFPACLLETRHVGGSANSVFSTQRGDFRAFLRTERSADAFSSSRHNAYTAVPLQSPRKSIVPVCQPQTTPSNRVADPSKKESSHSLSRCLRPQENMLTRRTRLAPFFGSSTTPYSSTSFSSLAILRSPRNSSSSTSCSSSRSRSSSSRTPFLFSLTSPAINSSSLASLTAFLSFSSSAVTSSSSLSFNSASAPLTSPSLSSPGSRAPRLPLRPPVKPLKPPRGGAAKCSGGSYASRTSAKSCSSGASSEEGRESSWQDARDRGERPEGSRVSVSPRRDFEPEFPSLPSGRRCSARLLRGRRASWQKGTLWESQDDLARILRLSLVEAKAQRHTKRAKKRRERGRTKHRTNMEVRSSPSASREQTPRRRRLHKPSVSPSCERPGRRTADSWGRWRCEGRGDEAEKNDSFCQTPPKTWKRLRRAVTASPTLCVKLADPREGSHEKEGETRVCLSHASPSRLAAAFSALSPFGEKAQARRLVKPIRAIDEDASEGAREETETDRENEREIGRERSSDSEVVSPSSRSSRTSPASWKSSEPSDDERKRDRRRLGGGRSKAGKRQERRRGAANEEGRAAENGEGDGKAFREAESANERERFVGFAAQGKQTRDKHAEREEEELHAEQKENAEAEREREWRKALETRKSRLSALTKRVQRNSLRARLVQRGVDNPDEELEKEECDSEESEESADSHRPFRRRGSRTRLNPGYRFLAFASDMCRSGRRPHREEERSISLSDTEENDFIVEDGDEDEVTPTDGSEEGFVADSEEDEEALDTGQELARRASYERRMKRETDQKLEENLKLDEAFARYVQFLVFSLFSPTLKFPFPTGPADRRAACMPRTRHTRKLPRDFFLTAVKKIEGLMPVMRATMETTAFPTRLKSALKEYPVCTVREREKAANSANRAEPRCIVCGRCQGARYRVLLEGPVCDTDLLYQGELAEWHVANGLEWLGREAFPDALDPVRRKADEYLRQDSTWGMLTEDAEPGKLTRRHRGRRGRENATFCSGVLEFAVGKHCGKQIRAWHMIHHFKHRFLKFMHSTIKEFDPCIRRYPEKVAEIFDELWRQQWYEQWCMEVKDPRTS
uniref:DUF4211 domain-containing protein n=1 Tax=Toxoplasma gondii COUG TaxID=1074873 RepID=A0A2G8Y963_TOXGO|nr:hypothetical protein TGCOUG_224030 [Toxoplasma gondii COUG]